MKCPWCPVIVAVVLAAGLAALLRAESEGEPLDPVAEAAVAFLAALDDEKRALAIFDFDSAERRNWQPVPNGEAGVRLETLDAPQRERLRALVGAVLSREGVATVDGVMLLEGLLVAIEEARGRPSPFHGPERYFLTIFGDPSRAGTWSWRLEGHHLSMTFTCSRGAWTAHGPLFVGSQPARVEGGEHDGLRLLGPRDDDVRALVAALDDEQRALAVVTGAVPRNILLVPGEDSGFDDERGLAAAHLDSARREQLLAAIQGWVDWLRPDLAKAELARITANLDQTRVLWIGVLDPAAAHYWRIVGPTFAIEYVAPEFDPNHVHALWRDLERDFGGKLLLEHP